MSEWRPIETCPRGYTMTRYFNTVPYRWAQWPVTPPGCVCPPTSEQTCQSPVRPRKAPAKETSDV